jgi:hypothetical protein
MARELRSPDDFERFMQEIDATMQRDGIPIHARELVALSEAAKSLEKEFIGHPRKPQPTPGTYSDDDLPGHIFEWARRRYGDRLRFDFTNG